MINQTTATVRKDILKDNLEVPIGDEYYGSPNPLPYRWLGDEFQVLHRGRWKTAMSVDFDFLK